MKHKLLYLNILSILFSTEAFKILAVFPLPGQSHSILGHGMVDHLAKAGHKITYITAFPRVNPPTGVREVDASSNTKFLPVTLLDFKAIINKESHLSNMTNKIRIMSELTSETLKNPSVNKILEDPEEKFDAIIVNWMFFETYTGIKAVFQCPFIWLSTMEPHWTILRLIDEVPSPAYSADVMSGNVPPFNFVQRVQELAHQIVGFTLRYLYFSGLENSLYEKILVPIIKKRGNPVPAFEELRYDVSLILGNSHESIGKTLRLPANYKNIGGFHIDESVKPLPVDLKKIMNNATHGVIYFSMGSILKSKHMPEDLKQSLLKMFGSLKQTVLWKFEEDLLNRPSNTHIIQWAPQQSILAHPKCVLFITHGGVLSLTEAVYHAKPIIGIPVKSDQFSNIDRAVKKGFAIRVDLSMTMADNIKIAIEEIINNKQYAEKAKELSFVYHDRPVHPAKEMVHWVEHVIKTKGAPHLKSPAVGVPLYQKLYLDLIVIVFSILYVMKYIIMKIVSKCKTYGKKNIFNSKQKMN